MNKRLIFLHLPKNAGTTLNQILKSKYGKDEIFDINYDHTGFWNIAEYQSLSEEKKEDIKFISGHFDFGIHRHLVGDFSYLTMLRHPVERTISFYNFIKKEKTHRLLDAVKDKTLLECVTEIKDYDVVNGQARKLSKSSDEKTMLDLALKNIDSHFTFVGIQEYFDESMVLLNEVLQLNLKHFDSLNKGIFREKYNPELIKEIEKQNQVDIELYETIKDRFLQNYSKIKFKSTKKFYLKGMNKCYGFKKKITGQ